MPGTRAGEEVVKGQKIRKRKTVLPMKRELHLTFQT